MHNKEMKILGISITTKWLNALDKVIKIWYYITVPDRYTGTEKPNNQGQTCGNTEIEANADNV